MRRVYSGEVSNSILTDGSYIQKYLGTELRAALNPTPNTLNGVSFSDIYVRMPYLEEQFQSFFSPTTQYIDQCVFLTGLTGCGKSSVLNYLFKIDAKKIHISQDTLIIPISFDNNLRSRSLETITDYFTSIMSTASSFILDELVKRGISEDNTTFYSYINQVRPDLLHLNMEDSSQQAVLHTLLKRSPLEYALLELKYRLTCLNKVKQVIVIIDDIESVGATNELIPIDIGLAIWSCLKNQPQGQPPLWASSIIVSCRHYVYRMIRNRSIEKEYLTESHVTSQTLESYPIDHEINISTPAKLYDIVTKRLDALANAAPHNRWENAREVIEHILFRVDSSFGELIVNICINNLRKALALLQKVIFNKRWIQRDYVMPLSSQGAFDLDIRNYKLTPPCLLRALILGEGIVYDDTGDIPNILANEADEASDLITLFTLMAYINATQQSLYDWHNTTNRTLVEYNLCQVLPPESREYVSKASKYLIQKRLLLRSKWQAQDDGLDISEDTIDKISKVYVSKAASQLWTLLGKSSVLFELYSDDLFVDFDFPFQERAQYSVFDSVTYERCLKHLENLVNREGRIRIYAHNHGFTTRLNSLIGSKFLTAHLLHGFQESRDKYYRFSSDERYQNDLNALKAKIDSYVDSLKD